MKFRLERDVLADAVAWAARTLPSRPSMPMLAGLLIDAEPGGLTLSTFDYDVSGRVSIDAEVDTPGRVLVSGRLLADIARALPAAPVTVDSDGSRVTVACGRSSFTLPTLPVDDYPALPDMPGSSGTVAGSVLANAVAQVAIAAGRDDTLPTLTGVRIEFTDSTMTLAATDRYRLAVRELLWHPERSGVETHALVPARTLAETAKSLAGCDQVRIALASAGAGDGIIGFEGDGRRTTSRLLDGEFPKYRTLLPTESSTVATVETAALIDAVKRVSLVAERNTPVRLTFSTRNRRISAAKSSNSAAGRERTSCGPSMARSSTTTSSESHSAS